MKPDLAFGGLQVTQRHPVANALNDRRMKLCAQTETDLLMSLKSVHGLFIDYIFQLLEIM